MLRRTPLGALVVTAVTLAAAPARADQVFSVNLGYFALRGDDTRVEGDVLLANRQNAVPLAFRTEDFNNAVFGGEWLVGLGDFVEAGVGVGYHRRTVASVYERLVDSDGTEIDQDLTLRIVPITATVRLLPLGRRSAFQPYVGGGVGLFNWRYSEVGEFVDPSDLTIFSARFTEDGTDAGPILLGGVRFPLSDQFMMGGEIRYQRADGSLPLDFLGDKIDLGGYTYQAVLQFRF